jgi:hypothetical protein
MVNLESLDDRLSAFADKITDEEDAASLRSCLAVIREGWRGADRQANLVEDVEVLAENAAAIAVLVTKYARG